MKEGKIEQEFRYSVFFAGDNQYNVFKDSVEGGDVLVSGLKLFSFLVEYLYEKLKEEIFFKI